MLHHEAFDQYYVVGQFNHLEGKPVGRIIRFRGLLTNTSEPEKPMQSFTISPNPANESIHIQWPETAEGMQNMQVEIYNQLGQRVLYQHLKDKNVSIGHLPAGMYFVSIRSEQYVFVPQKLVVY